jgi:hypothetical protein
VASGAKDISAFPGVYSIFFLSALPWESGKPEVLGCVAEAEQVAPDQYRSRTGVLRLVRVEQECTLGLRTQTQLCKPGDYFLIDSCGPLLDAAKILAEAAGLNAKTSRKNIEELEAKHFTSKEGENMVHIYLLGYVWNELVKNAPARRKLLTLMTNHIKRKEPCLIFVAEPALEFMSRPAMELRDTLCENGYTALYPCPHSSPCPMLERPKDWCYTEGVWKQPPLAEWLDDQLDVNRSKHASTLFAFASPAMGLTSDNKPIVVGRPVREAGIDRYKGFFDYLLCDENGITKRKPQKPKQAVLRGSIFTEE